MQRIEMKENPEPFDFQEAMKTVRGRINACILMTQRNIRKAQKQLESAENEMKAMQIRGQIQFMQVAETKLTAALESDDEEKMKEAMLDLRNALFGKQAPTVIQP